VVRAERQPGSSFKPFVYETGFKNGSLKPDSILNDTRSQSQQLGGVQDFDRRFMGPITAARALLLSRNVATEQAMQIAGVDNVINFAHSAGITSPLAANASTGIGTSAVKMIDLASAYGAFANGGHKVTARGILKVVDGKGNVLADNSHPAGEGDVMTPAQAWSITNILKNYAKTWGLPFKWQTAGKSGTTDNFIDAWYTAYTPDWVVSTWAGHTDGNNPAQVGMNTVFGTTEAQYIAVPFVNSLSKPSAFVPVSGSVFDCSNQDSSFVPSDASCPTPTPSPTPSATPTPTPEPSSSPSLCATISPAPSPAPSLCPSPSASQAPAAGPTATAQPAAAPP
jgi:penicillin-binding protein 1A